MDYSELISAVSDELNLGTRYDSQIPAKLKQAIRNFEARLDFPYMRVECPLELSEGETSTLIIDALENKSANYTTNQVKKIRYLAFPDQAGPMSEFRYVMKVDRTDVAEIDEDDDIPSGYWIDNTQTLYFDRAIHQDYSYNNLIELDNSIKMGVVLYTDFDRIIGAAQDDTWDDTDECEEEFIAERWLLANAERALILRTCLNFASTIRDVKLLQLWKSELYGPPEQQSSNSEWDLLVQHVEDYDLGNTTFYMNPNRSKAAL